MGVLHRGRTPAWLAVLCCVCSGAGLAAQSRMDVSPPDLYRSYCAECHGAERMGGLGPPLLPAELAGLNRKRAADVIANGLAETHMPGFSDQLSAAQIDALVRFIYAPPASTTGRGGIPASPWQAAAPASPGGGSGAGVCVD